MKKQFYTREDFVAWGSQGGEYNKKRFAELTEEERRQAIEPAQKALRERKQKAIKPPLDKAETEA